MAKKPLPLNRQRSAFTLVEALVAITVTLIMMLALSKGFVMMSQSISEGRSKMNLSDQLRGISMKLREDLSGMTAGGDPNSESSRSGYFEYYEGPISDYLAALVNFDGNQTNIEQKNPASRYGDFDDILAFTAKTRKGQWFYGEVPYPIVMGPVLMNGGSTPTFTAEDWARSVTVASDTAEIVYFMMPYAADPAQFPLVTTSSPPYINFLTNTSPPPYALNTNLTPNILENDTDTVPGVPDRMMLCRRVLLVLPELNLPTGTLIPGGTSTLEPTLFHQGPPSIGDPSRLTQLNAMPLGEPGSADSYSYRFGMQMAYQRCDLSVRRASDGSLSDADPIAANSLADLQDPKNRFAHTVLPIGVNDTTMPIWSLTGPIQLQSVALTNNISLTANGQFGSSLASPNGELPEVGFLFPQFLRQRRTDRPLAQTATGQEQITFEMAFSEVLATNCIAFDVKGFDPTLTQWFHPGVNGVQEYGAPGSDDVVVSPSDPGYSNVITRLYTNWDVGAKDWSPTNFPDPYIARTGGFADLGWPVTLRTSALIENARQLSGHMAGTTNTWANQITSTNIPQLSSALSLTEKGDSLYTSGNPLFTTSILRSGKIVTSNPAGVLQVYQPTFDTFTSRYEMDGYTQDVSTSTSPYYDGNIWHYGQYQYKFAYGTLPATANNPDRGANGFDDNGIKGVDDLSEKDATPPVAAPLKAVQVTIRVEDKGASVIQQVVVDQELRLEN